MKIARFALSSALAGTFFLGSTAALASSHREAPAITEKRKLDNTDVYLFRSYEPGREAFVTMIANFQPFQDPGGAPNYYTMDPEAIYEIHIDNTGDAVEDLTFQFKFDNNLRNGVGNTLNIGGKVLSTALRFTGPITSPDDPDIAETEQFTLTQVSGNRRSGTKAAVTNASGGGTVFGKPVDYAGTKIFPDYTAYARQFIHTVNFPGCAVPGRVFAGQRAEGFAVNVNETFDLVNFVPIQGGEGGFPGGITQDRTLNDDLIGKVNITSLAIEVPIACVTGTGNGVIGVWSTASLPQARILDPSPTYEQPERVGGSFVQISRLANPLVNELVIGIDRKDLFNAARPTQDTALADFVTNPTFPAILNALFRAPVNATLGTNIADLAPNNFPRNDLVTTFLTGIPTLNQLRTVTPSEMMRLNTAVNPTPRATQSTFGVVGDDLAGYPNGRRPGDDVTDITLRVAMGRLCHPVPINGRPTDLGLCTPANAPVGLVPFTDGAPLSARDFQNAFPYLNTPIPGSTDEQREAIRVAPPAQ